MAYGSDLMMASYLLKTGRSVPNGYDISAVREMGALWVNSFTYRGEKVSSSQEDQFPRNRSNPVANPTPREVEYASYEAGYAYASGVDIWGGAGSQLDVVVREKVDVLEVQRAEPKFTNFAEFADAMRVLIPMAYRYLEPWLRRREGFSVVVGRKVIGCGC